jgi:predicted metal-dependent peptidase
MTPSEVQQVERKLVKARIALLLTQPFFATLAVRLRMEAVADGKIGGTPVPIAATDGDKFYYNPEGCATLSMDEAKGLWAHEVLHIAMLHQLRMQSRNPRKWNTAADFAINVIVKSAGLSLPAGHLDNPHFNGKHAEEIYRLLPDGDGGGGKGSGQCPPGGQQNGQAGGKPGGDDPSDFGMVLPAPPDQAATQEQEWRVAVQQAAHAARSCGKLPGGLEELVKSLRGPTAPWFDYLRKFISELMAADYTWSRPSRRSASLGVYLPSTVKQGVGAIDLAIDTSGSISNDELERFGSRFLTLHEELRPELLRVIYFDSIVQRVEEFGPDDTPAFNVKGRGGTDFRPIFDWITQSARELRCLVVLTDLQAAFPDEAPDYPVLWVTVADGMAPFGDTVRMEE